MSDAAEPTKAPTPYAVLDVDGVLADVQHRLHHLESHPKDWEAFFGDAPRDPLLEEGLEVALDLAREHEIVYLTGRPERCRDATKAWLAKYQFPPGQIIMRSDTDRRPARVMKIAELNGLRKQGRVALLIDDDEQVVAAAEGRGFVVRHATWMYREQHEGQSLSTAQESEGRT